MAEEISQQCTYTVPILWFARWSPEISTQSRTTAGYTDVRNVAKSFEMEKMKRMMDANVKI
jgi:hypothetical protein